MSTQTSLLKVWLSQHISNIIDPSESVLLLELQLILKLIFRTILNYHHYVKRRIVPERKERVKGNCHQCQVPPMPSVCRGLRTVSTKGMNESSTNEKYQSPIEAYVLVTAVRPSVKHNNYSHNGVNEFLRFYAIT
jgi:hypothetical protein